MSHPLATLLRTILSRITRQPPGPRTRALMAVADDIDRGVQSRLVSWTLGDELVGWDARIPVARKAIRLVRDWPHEFAQGSFEDVCQEHSLKECPWEEIPVIDWWNAVAILGCSHADPERVERLARNETHGMVWGESGAVIFRLGTNPSQR